MLLFVYVGLLSRMVVLFFSPLPVFYSDIPLGFCAILTTTPPPPKKKKIQPQRIKTVRVVEVVVCTLSLRSVTLTDSRWDPVSAAVDKRSIDPAVDVSMALTR